MIILLDQSNKEIPYNNWCYLQVTLTYRKAIINYNCLCIIWRSCAYCIRAIFLFLLEDECFTVLCWVLPYVSMNQPQVYLCPLPAPEPASHPLPTPPLGCHRAVTGPSSVCLPAGSHLLSVLRVVMCLFPGWSLNSSHPLLPPLCPQVCSTLYVLCLHCYPANRFISTIFPDSRCMC